MERLDTSSLMGTIQACAGVSCEVASRSRIDSDAGFRREESRHSKASQLQATSLRRACRVQFQKDLGACRAPSLVRRAADCPAAQLLLCFALSTVRQDVPDKERRVAGGSAAASESASGAALGSVKNPIHTLQVRSLLPCRSTAPPAHNPP